MTHNAYVIDTDPHIKKISKNHVWETADRWSILTGDYFILYWPRVAASKGKKGMVGLKIVPKGYMVDQGKDYGELTHRKALEVMAAYAHNKTNTPIPVKTESEPKPVRPMLDRDGFKEIVSSCSVMMLGKLIKHTMEELNMFGREVRRGVVAAHGNEISMHTLIILSRYDGVYQKYGKFRDRKVIGNVRTTLLTLWPIVKVAAMRYRQTEGKGMFPAKYNAVI